MNFSVQSNKAQLQSNFIKLRKILDDEMTFSCLREPYYCVIIQVYKNSIVMPRILCTSKMKKVEYDSAGCLTARNKYMRRLHVYFEVGRM
jgi:hypothetical protein